MGTDQYQEGTDQYQDIVEVIRILSHDDANKYLALGWEMLNIESSQHSEHDWTTKFVLGWRTTKGTVKRPDIKSWTDALHEGEDKSPEAGPL